MTYPPKILAWAKAVSNGEGALASSNNPGNLKFTSLTESWGASMGERGSDGGYLCQFPDYQTGMNALCNFLTLGAEDELKAFHEARTLQTFTVIYAGNPPEGYIEAIANELGVPLDVLISTFLN